MPTKTTTVRIRTRGRSSFSYVPPNGDKYPNFETLLAPTASYRNDTSSVTADGPNPGFRQKIEHGLEATTFLSGSRRKTDQSEGVFAYGGHSSPTSQTWYWSYVAGNFVVRTPYTGTLTVSTSAINQAKARFIQAAIREQTAFQGGTFLGELNESLRMIRQPAKALRKGIDDYFNALKRRRKGPDSHRRRVVADTWLEYQFGWKPLISDISDACQALDRIRYRRRPFKMVRGTGSDVVDVPSPVWDNDVGSLHFTTRNIERIESNAKYYGVVNLDVSNGFSMSAQNLGFRWDSFVPTLWELVPYSFLVDYFTNIGDIISSWSYASANLRWSSRGTRVHREVTAVVGNPWWDANPRHEPEWIIRPCSARASSTTVLRTPLAGSLVPTLELEIPGSRSLKWLNLAALASSRRRLTPY